MNEICDAAATNIEPAQICAPPSKSLTHRYLVGAALAHGVSALHNILESEDTRATREILCQAGARMVPLTEKADDGTQIAALKIYGMPGRPQGGKDKPLECDVGESGTTCRLLTAVLSAGSGLFRIFGRGRMCQRPVADLCESLEKLGTGIVYEENSGYPPFIIQARGINPELSDGYIQVAMEVSSQYVSGLLLAAPLASSPLCIELGGRKSVSWPYVGLTLQCLTDFGIKFRVERRPRLSEPWTSMQGASWKKLQEARPGCVRIRVWPGNYLPGEYNVEGDWSQASYFLAAGALGKRPVRVCGLNPESLQGDKAILDILSRMGARIETSGNAITVYPSALRGMALDMGSCPDLVPTVAVLAAFAKGSTRISNVSHLRVKESDRIKAPADELAKFGITVDPLSDGMLINGTGGHNGHVRGRPGGINPATDVALCAHNDHRIAMSLALAELVNPSLNVRARLDDAGVVKKSCPDFWNLWDKIR